MFISSYMNHDPVVIHPNTLIADARNIILSNKFRHLPVVDEEMKLVGMVTDRDIRSAFPSSVASVMSEAERKHETERISKIPVKNIMSVKLATLRPESTLDDALLLLESQRVGALPVVDEAGKLMGIFSIRDLLRAYSAIFGLAEKGSQLLVVADDESANIMGKIVGALEGNGISFTRIVRMEMAKRIFVRVQTANIKAVQKAMDGAGLKLCYF